MMKIYMRILHIRYRKKRNDGINFFICNWLRFNYSLVEKHRMYVIR